MPRFSALRHLAGAALAALPGCASAPEPAAERPASPASRHGYALLYTLMSQEKNVSKLLIIKREREDFAALIGDIAETAGRAHERLDELAEADPSLDLEDTGLPRAELETREAIQSTRTKQLLTESGEEFEIQLMLAQNEALTYALHLAEVLARAEPDTARLEFVRGLWKELQGLQSRLWSLLRSRYRWTPPS
jgi:hypothetical protein